MVVSAIFCEINWYLQVKFKDKCKRYAVFLFDCHVIYSTSYGRNAYYLAVFQH